MYGSHTSTPQPRASTLGRPGASLMQGQTRGSHLPTMGDQGQTREMRRCETPARIRSPRHRTRQRDPHRCDRIRDVNKEIITEKSKFTPSGRAAFDVLRVEERMTKRICLHIPIPQCEPGHTRALRREQLGIPGRSRKGDYQRR
eukprot:scaffold43883_cov32-Tisochrysis_lutea.AAC.5